MMMTVLASLGFWCLCACAQLSFFSFENYFEIYSKLIAMVLLSEPKILFFLNRNRKKKRADWWCRREGDTEQLLKVFNILIKPCMRCEMIMIKWKKKIFEKVAMMKRVKENRKSHRETCLEYDRIGKMCSLGALNAEECISWNQKNTTHIFFIELLNVFDGVCYFWRLLSVMRSLKTSIFVCRLGCVSGFSCRMRCARYSRHNKIKFIL